MIRQLTWGALLIAAPAPLFANGRAPATSSIHFESRNDQHIVAGTTFGLLRSEDGGQSWRWTCEQAVGYGGEFDPAYVYHATGAVFATTYLGFSVSRDRCSFGPTALGTKLITTLGVGPTGQLFAAASQPAMGVEPADSSIYRSSDDGVTFPVSATPAPADTWWTTITVAPTDPSRVYAVGYRFADGIRTLDMYYSLDGGQTYQAMQQTGITMTAASVADIVGVSRQNPDHLYLRITFQDIARISEAIFMSIDRGNSWTKIRDETATISFLARANGDLIVATKTSAVISRSPSQGASWEQLPNTPMINCLAENAAREIWACTQNYGVPGDNAGMMKTSDLVTWTPVLRYQDIQGPLECPAGTLQHDRCVFNDPPPRSWCILRSQLGIVADPTVPECSLPDGVMTKPGGCCETGAARRADLGLALIVLFTLRQPRRCRHRLRRKPG